MLQDSLNRVFRSVSRNLTHCFSATTAPSYFRRPRDSETLDCSTPKVETLGYCRMSLWDKDGISIPTLRSCYPWQSSPATHRAAKYHPCRRNRQLRWPPHRYGLRGSEKRAWHGPSAG